VSARKRGREKDRQSKERGEKRTQRKLIKREMRIRAFEREGKL